MTFTSYKTGWANLTPERPRRLFAQHLSRPSTPNGTSRRQLKGICKGIRCPLGCAFAARPSRNLGSYFCTRPRPEDQFAAKAWWPDPVVVSLL
jgi:hypothetical protein